MLSTAAFFFFPFASLKRPNLILGTVFYANPELYRDKLKVLPKPWSFWKRESGRRSGFTGPQAPWLSWSTTEPCPALNDKQFYIKGNMKTQLIRSHRVD